MSSNNGLFSNAQYEEFLRTIKDYIFENPEDTSVGTISKATRIPVAVIKHLVRQGRLDEVKITKKKERLSDITFSETESYASSGSKLVADLNLKHSHH